MSQVPVTPKCYFLEWTGTNLDEWQERWSGNAWVDSDGLWFGPTIGPIQIGGGLVDGPCGGTYYTRADLDAAFSTDDAEPQAPAE